LRLRSVRQSAWGSQRPYQTTAALQVAAVRCIGGTITGIATGLGGMLHTFPFLIPNLTVALNTAYVVVFCELLTIAFIRYRFMGGKLANTIVQIVIGGSFVFAIGVLLGRVGAS
jgi:erythrin-vacuolar iron transport family protein